MKIHEMEKKVKESLKKLSDEPFGNDFANEI